MSPWFGRGGNNLAGSNTLAGWTQLIELARKHSVERIVLEATGGYDACGGRTGRCWFAGRSGQPGRQEIPPRRRAGWRKPIASMPWIGSFCRGDPTAGPSAARTKKPWNCRKNWPVIASWRRCITAESNRLLKSVQNPFASIQAVLKIIEQQLESIDSDIDQRIEESPVWREKDRILQSVPGIGPHTAHTF